MIFLPNKFGQTELRFEAYHKKLKKTFKVSVIGFLRGKEVDYIWTEEAFPQHFCIQDIVLKQIDLKKEVK